MARGLLVFGVKFPDEGVCRRAFKFYSVTSGCVAGRLSVILCRVAKCLRVLALMEWSAVRVAREIAFPLYFSCGCGGMSTLGDAQSPRLASNRRH